MRLALPKSRVATLDTEDCFWAALDASASSGLRGKARRRALLFALEQELPLPLEEIHAVFVEQPHGKVAACASKRDVLIRLAESADIVIPKTVPGWLECDREPSTFNLLSDGCASRRASRLRTVSCIGVVVLLGILSGLLTAGFAIRDSGFQRQRENTLNAILAAQNLVLPPAGAGVQPASIRLAALLRTTKTNTQFIGDTGSPPATDALEQVLARWPQDAQLQRLAIGKRDIRIDLTMPSDFDPSVFIGALENVAGWALSAPVVRRSDVTTSVSLRLQRLEGAGG